MYVSICGEKIHPTAQPLLNARTDNGLRQVGGGQMMSTPPRPGKRNPYSQAVIRDAYERFVR